MPVARARAPRVLFGRMNRVRGLGLKIRATLLLIALMLGPAFALGAVSQTHVARVRSARLRSPRRVRWSRARLARLHAMILASPVHGTRDSLVRQNERINQENLERIQDDDQLAGLIDSEDLVRLPETRELGVAQNLPVLRRYCRPWTRDFAEDFAAAHFDKFRRGFEITSAVRTVEFQHKLIRHNHNAAAEVGDLASPHLSGATIDIAKRGLTRKEIQWARQYLLEMQNKGLLDVEEEFRQSVFHITVYRQYSEPAPVEAQAAGESSGQ
jgi:Family of unknown function (DUF5715)